MPFESAPLNYSRRPAIAQNDVAAFMWATYRWMAAGLGLTGVVAWLVANTPAVSHFIFGNQLVFFGLMIAELIMVVTFTRRVATASPGDAAAMFLGYAMLNGATLSVVFLAYTGAAISQAFFVSAGAFCALSAYGTLTKRDLSPMAQFLFVGLVGVCLASLANIFLHSSGLSFVTSCAGALVFAGLTAYDNQRLKSMYIASGGANNLAIHGALMLYLNFINMFLFVLRLFNNRR